MALTLTDVGFTYAAGTPLAQRALEGVSLALEPGELALVLGPSGSGKTTLLRVAAGLLAPTQGAVLVDGAAPRPGRGGVGLAFQRTESQLFAETVLADVSFGPANLGLAAGEAAEAARNALSSVGLDPETFGERTPFSLSGGEARRAALAGVLAMSPRYLLLDEPTSGLDAPGRAAVARAIASARQSAGVVIVTHDAEEFLDAADSVTVISDGAQAYSGDVAGLLTRADELEAAGSWTAPETVRLQALAARDGRLAGALTLDPVEAARQLTAKGGRA